jgi:hypothetical protein
MGCVHISTSIRSHDTSAANGRPNDPAFGDAARLAALAECARRSAFVQDRILRRGYRHGALSPLGAQVGAFTPSTCRRSGAEREEGHRRRPRPIRGRMRRSRAGRRTAGRWVGRRLLVRLGGALTDIRPSRPCVVVGNQPQVVPWTGSSR